MSFFIISSNAPLKDQMMSILYPKPPSFAASNLNITGNIFIDTNGNGVKDSGEQNYQSGEITLSDLTHYDYSGNLLSQNVHIFPEYSDANGNYTFSNIPSGDSYQISATIPGYKITTFASSNGLLNLPLLSNNQTVNFGIQKKPTNFPNILLSFFDIHQIDPNAGFLQMTDYDVKNHRILYYPWGNISADAGRFSRTATPSGILVTYDKSGSFTDPKSWHTYDMTRLANPHAWGRGGGFLDDVGNYSYMPPIYDKDSTGKITQNSTFVRANLNKDLATTGAYETFDVNTMSNPPPHVGSYTGIYANGYAYFTPTVDESTGFVHGVFIRYNSAKSFTDPSAWDWMDLRQPSVATNAASYQSIIYKAPYVYLIPDGDTLDMFVRYDTTKSFTDPTSYTVYDFHNLNPFPSWLTGVMINGNNLIMVPWRNVTTTPAGASTVAVKYDMSSPYGMTDSRSYQTFDITKVDPLASGYQYGWVDKDQNVWFVPDGNYAQCSALSMSCNGVVYPPYIVWNSHLSFTDPNSWTTYPSLINSTQRGLPASGAAYDPVTNKAYTAPWGTLMSEVQIYSAGQPVPSVTPPSSDSNPPIVSWAYPTNNQVLVPGKIVTLQPAAGDNKGVAKVDIYINNEIFCSPTTSPYSCSWAVPTTNGVGYTLKAEAFDLSGNSASSTISVTANDTTLPNVSWAFPKDGAQIYNNRASTFQITAYKSNGLSISKVQIFDGSTLVCTMTTSPYTCSYTMPGQKGDAHTLKATATDILGNSASAQINVTIR